MKRLVILSFCLFAAIRSFGIGAIMGTTTVCVGQTTPLTDATTGGVWSSSNYSVASVGSSSGLVYGVSAGTAVITYDVGGSIVVTGFTVLPSPTAIVGSGTICVGATAPLSDAVIGGTWASSNTGVATVVTTSGIVTGVSAGSAVISYILATGCYAVATEVVVPVPAAIGGAGTVCAGQPVTLTDAVTGGTWTSGNMAVGTIGAATGTFVGISAGTTSITYTVGGACSVHATEAVLPNAPITGPDVVCIPAPTTGLTDAVGGGTWSSSNTMVATVSSTSGVVTGVSVGTVIISYTTAAGCTSTFSMLADECEGVPGIHSAGSSISLMPNPAISQITVATAGAFTAAVYDETGRLMNRSDFRDTGVINVQSYPPGVYIVLFSGQFGVETRKFVKQTE